MDQALPLNSARTHVCLDLYWDGLTNNNVSLFTGSNILSDYVATRFHRGGVLLRGVSDSLF